jgi:peptide/nickel transport system substrate-binding protein
MTWATPSGVSPAPENTRPFRRPAKRDREVGRDADGKPLAINPLNDRRVREALSVAIDRPSIAARVMEGMAVPSGQFLPDGSFGHVPGLDAPRTDPARARALLAEAGYPRGFRMTVHGPNDRYVNDARIIQAIGQMWTRIGVQTTVEAMPWSTYVGRASKQDFSAFLWGWGSNSGEASNPLRALTATYDRARGWGASNRARYSNAEHDRLLGEGLRTLGDPAREALFQQATRVAMENVGIVPLHRLGHAPGTAACRAGGRGQPATGYQPRAVTIRRAGALSTRPTPAATPSSR